MALKSYQKRYKIWLMIDMNKYEKMQYKAIIAKHYLDDELITEHLESCFKYFNCEIMRFIIEARFRDGRADKYIIQHIPGGQIVNKNYIQIKINIFLQQLKYGMK